LFITLGREVTRLVVQPLSLPPSTFWLTCLCGIVSITQALGDSEGFGEQIQKLKDFEFNRELEAQFGRSDPRLKGIHPDFSIFGESSLFNQGNIFFSVYTLLESFMR